MQRFYLVCYDIRDPKRLRKVHQIMKGYGAPWQLSVFLCQLHDIDRVRMEADLSGVMNLKTDQAIVIDLGANERTIRAGITVIGPSLPKRGTGLVVV